MIISAYDRVIYAALLVVWGMSIVGMILAVVTPTIDWIELSKNATLTVGCLVALKWVGSR